MGTLSSVDGRQKRGGIPSRKKSLGDYLSSPPSRPVSQGFSSFLVSFLSVSFRVKRWKRNTFFEGTLSEGCGW